MSSLACALFILSMSTSTCLSCASLSRNAACLFVIGSTHGQTRQDMQPAGVYLGPWPIGQAAVWWTVDWAQRMERDTQCSAHHGDDSGGQAENRHNCQCMNGVA